MVSIGSRLLAQDKSSVSVLVVQAQPPAGKEMGLLDVVGLHKASIHHVLNM